LQTAYGATGILSPVCPVPARAIVQEVGLGTLRSVLFELGKDNISAHLLKLIAFHLASGMAFLHNVRPPVYLRHMSPDNVLLFGEKVPVTGGQTIIASPQARLAPPPLLWPDDVAQIQTSAWHAPDALSTDYTSKSDVRLFGLLLFWMWTRDRDPPVRAPEEHCLVMPSECPPDWVQLISRCVNVDVAARPEFMELVLLVNSLRPHM